MVLAIVCAGVVGSHNAWGGERVRAVCGGRIGDGDGDDTW